MKKTSTVVLAAVALTGGLTVAQLEAEAIQSEIVIQQYDEDEDYIEEESKVVSIPDENLKKYINEQLGNYENPTQDVTEEQMLSLECLYLDEKKIVNLEGLQYAKNLRELDLGNGNYFWMTEVENYNNIQDLSPISELVHLTSLNLNGNNITNLDVVSKLTNLTYLEAKNNNISDLSALRGLTQLTHLKIEDNPINDLSILSGLINLQFLNISQTNVKDLSVLTNLKELKSLEANYLKVSNFDFLKQLTELYSLSLNGVGLTSLDIISDLKQLTSLEIADNKLVSLRGLEKLENLYLLDISKNNVNNFVPIYNLTELTELVADEVGLTDISFINNYNLRGLSVSGNQITDISPAYFTQHTNARDQIIKLEPIVIKKGETVVLENPLPGDCWKNEPYFEGEGINVKGGSFDILTNKLTWENVTTNQLEFTFNHYFGNDRSPSIFNGTVTIPVDFYSIPEAFDKLVENDAITIVGGTGDVETPLVLEIAQGTKKDVIEELIESYSDYTLTVSKMQTRSSLESYKLTFEKGDEKVYFELKVNSSDEEIIRYLDDKVGTTTPPAGGETPPAGGETPPAGGETPPTGGEAPPTGGETPPAGGETPPTGGEAPPTGGETPPAGGETPPTGGETPPAGGETPPPTEGSSDSSEHPETGFSGLMGMMGLGALSLGAVFTKRKKK